MNLHFIIFTLCLFVQQKRELEAFHLQQIPDTMTGRRSGGGQEAEITDCVTRSGAESVEGTLRLTPRTPGGPQAALGVKQQSMNTQSGRRRWRRCASEGERAREHPVLLLLLLPHYHPHVTMGAVGSDPIV